MGEIHQFYRLHHGPALWSRAQKEFKRGTFKGWSKGAGLTTLAPLAVLAEMMGKGFILGAGYDPEKDPNYKER